MKTQNIIIDQTGKILKRKIKEDDHGKYVSHKNMKAYIEFDNVISGDLVETTMYSIQYYRRTRA